jgi:hypothetical protein
MNKKAVDKFYKEMRENVEKYGHASGGPDKETGKAFEFQDKRITCFFNVDKTSVILSYFIQDHQTASITLSIEAAYFTMRLIEDKLREATP